MSDCIRFYRKDEAKSAQYGEKVYAEVCIPVEAFNAALDHYGFVKERTCKRVWTGAEMICSECAFQLNNATWNYCPSCGAKVVE